MPPRDVSQGQDGLSVGIYLADGPDDAGLLAWKRSHPDCFEAGTWTPSPAPGNGQPRNVDATKRGGPDVGRGTERAPLDPATLSLADFRAVADQAKRTRPDLRPAPGPPDRDAPA